MAPGAGMGYRGQWPTPGPYSFQTKADMMQETVTVTAEGADREQTMLRAHALLTQWSDEYMVLAVDVRPVENLEALQAAPVLVRWEAEVTAMVMADTPDTVVVAV